jgi:hypothetical protein
LGNPKKQEYLKMHFLAMLIFIALDTGCLVAAVTATFLKCGSLSGLNTVHIWSWKIRSRGEWP